MQHQLSKKTSGQDLTAFQTVLEFVCDLQECFGSDKHEFIRPLNLYHRLISKMSLRDDELILRHLNVFKDFCISNREQIRARDKDLRTKRIEFTDRIYIDMGYIFRKTDEDSEESIWQYLLAISAYLDPDNKTKELLQQLRQEDSQEGNFLASMMDSFSPLLQGMAGSSEGGVNPMDMMGSLMGSDLFSKMFSSFGGGDSKLDMGQLIKSVSGIMENVKNEIEKSDDPVIKQFTQMMNIPMSTEGKDTPVPETTTPTTEIVDVEAEPALAFTSSSSS